MREKIDQAANGIGGRPLALATCSTFAYRNNDGDRMAAPGLFHPYQHLGGICCSGISVATFWLYRSSNSS